MKEIKDNLNLHYDIQIQNIITKNINLQLLLEDFYYEKKTIMASSLAVALGVTGYAAGTGHQAHAAEVNVDQAHLVDLAHNHQASIKCSSNQRWCI